MRVISSKTYVYTCVEKISYAFEVSGESITRARDGWWWLKGKSAAARASRLSGQHDPGHHSGQRALVRPSNTPSGLRASECGTAKIAACYTPVCSSKSYSSPVFTLCIIAMDQWTKLQAGLAGLNLGQSANKFAKGFNTTVQATRERIGQVAADDITELPQGEHRGLSA